MKYMENDIKILDISKIFLFLDYKNHVNCYGYPLNEGII